MFRRPHQGLEHSHDSKAIAERLAGGPNVSYLRDWIYGGIDGAVTTFAIVAGVEGAALSPTIVLVLGAANLLADGFSMAAANASATKAEADHARRLELMEHRHIRLDPEGEREEIRQIFAARGFTDDDLERAVEISTATHDRWVRTMMLEEHGIVDSVRSPMKAALATFIAFGICGAVPLLPFLFAFEADLTLATILTGMTFFAIGSLKSLWSPMAWWRSGLETLAIGMAAAGIAYAVGYALRAVV